jgi:hypothetical protein
MKVVENLGPVQTALLRQIIFQSKCTFLLQVSEACAHTTMGRRTGCYKAGAHF